MFSQYSMAYLNVRERRLETKIAYVGAARSGRATNFERLGGGELGGDVLGLYWEPTAETTFRDCDIRVHLVTSRGSPTGEQIVELLRDADGVVFVADAAPDAQERNRLSLALVREALSRQSDRQVPIVVQMNKSDLPDAVAAETITAQLELGQWPQITAAAARGEGVVETLERALAGVLEQLRKTSSDDTPASAAASETTRPAAQRSAPREGNPLLTALRQVLRETVTAEVDELELRLSGRLEQLFARIEGESTSLLREVLHEQVEVRRALETTHERAEHILATLSTANALLATSIRAVGVELSSHRSELAALRDRLSNIDTKVDELVPVTGSLVLQAEELAALREGVKSAQMTVRVGATDVTRAIDASTRAERELLGTATTQIRRAIEALSLEVKGTDARAVLGARIDQVENVLKREVRQGVEVVSLKVDAGRDTGVLAIADAGQRTTEVHALLEAVVEELKKPKKSWFT